MCVYMFINKNDTLKIIIPCFLVIYSFICTFVSLKEKKRHREKEEENRRKRNPFYLLLATQSVIS
jgi:hypothetical protein